MCDKTTTRRGLKFGEDKAEHHIHKKVCVCVKEVKKAESGWLVMQMRLEWVWEGG